MPVNCPWALIVAMSVVAKAAEKKVVECMSVGTIQPIVCVKHVREKL